MNLGLLFLILTEWIGEYKMKFGWQKNNAIMIIGLLFCSCEDIITRQPDGFDPADWVELHNPTDESITIGLWKFKDEREDHVFIIPEDRVIQPGQYLVLCRDTLAFKDNFPNVGNFVGNLNFGFKGGGELVRLFNSDGSLVDEVKYDNSPPWPTEPDGNGPTLELLHPSLDNKLGENWAASDSHGGTPGAVNSVYLTDISNSSDSGVVINEINYNSADE